MSNTKTETNKSTNEAQIRARLEDWAKAVHAKDVEAVMSHYAPDILFVRPRASASVPRRW
jgi:ketosteroid isomerase-like protein